MLSTVESCGDKGLVVWFLILSSRDPRMILQRQAIQLCLKVPVGKGWPGAPLIRSAWAKGKKLTRALDVRTREPCVGSRGPLEGPGGKQGHRDIIDGTGFSGSESDLYNRPSVQSVRALRGKAPGVGPGGEVSGSAYVFQCRSTIFKANFCIKLLSLRHYNRKRCRPT